MDKFRRLYLDIEVSPDIVFTWETGFKLTISPENIIKERAIICIAWNWEDETTVHCETWDDGDDYKLLKKFVPIMESATEIVGHNSDKFDVPWIKTRAMYHGIPIRPGLVTSDTYQWAK